MPFKQTQRSKIISESPKKRDLYLTMIKHLYSFQNSWKNIVYKICKLNSPKVKKKNSPTVMSQPPKNSPSMYNCGKVGQLEYSFRPRRNASFESTSRVSKGTFRDFNICTTVWEKPHWGKSLLPFMNKRTLWELTTLSSVDFNSELNPAYFWAQVYQMTL